MRTRTMAHAAAAAAIALTVAPDAVAHSVSRPTPPAGDGGTVFVFKGRAWQPRGRIRADYYRKENGRRPFRQFRSRVKSDGRFTFRLSDPWFYDTGRLQKVCFVQLDTRFGRGFRKCQRFYVAPASAYFMPADGLAGQLFILVANGFQAGRRLNVELTRPDGVVETASMTTRRRGGLVAGGEFGSIYLPRGGAALRFQSRPTDLLGLYAAFVFEPGIPARARAAVRLRPA